MVVDFILQILIPEENVTERFTVDYIHREKEV